jgi:hypothetical protein
MSLIERDDRRWILWRVDGAEPVIERGGSVIPLGEAVEVVPAATLRGAVEERDRLRAELDALRESRDAWRLQAMREHDEGLPE